MMLTIVLVLIAIMCLIGSFTAFGEGAWIWGAFMLVLSATFGYWGYGSNTPEFKASEAAREARNAAQRIQDQTPYVISTSPDGCKVYTFKAGDRWHYFTRCASTTTTESSYSVRHGKQTRTEVEVITQQNGDQP